MENSFKKGDWVLAEINDEKCVGVVTTVRYTSVPTIRWKFAYTTQSGERGLIDIKELRQLEYKLLDIT